MTSLYKQSNRRVGVITLPGDSNYGNRLQLYASVAIWQSLGYDPEYLDWRRKTSPLVHPKRFVRSLLGGSRPLDGNEAARSKERTSAFERFGRLIPTKLVTSTSSIDSSDYSYFSTGSDQVWNPHSLMISCDASPYKRAYFNAVDPHELRDNMSWFFLGFAARDQRVTMAPSIGQDSLTKEELAWLADGVDNFDSLSVREARGAELIRSCSGREAMVVCDPTLAVEKSAWISVADDRVTPLGDYVLAYILGQQTEETEAAISLASLDGKIPVVQLSDRSLPGEPDAGPAEFISLVSHAGHVVTDSFHASVFASIFERPLTIVRRGGQGTGAMFSRLESLTKTLGIEDKVFHAGMAFDAPASEDYEGVAEAIAQERRRFMSYLAGCLERRGW